MALHAPKVKLETRSLRNIMLAKIMETKAKTNINGAKVSKGLTTIRKRCWVKNQW
jgi:hypothetical protein